MKTVPTLLAALCICSVGIAQQNYDKPNQPDRSTRDRVPQQGTQPTSTDADRDRREATDKASDKEPLTAQKFVSKVLHCGKSEVALGNLAASKATTPAVRILAERIVRDHTKSNEELKQIADRKGISASDDTSAKGEPKTDHK